MPNNLFNSMQSNDIMGEFGRFKSNPMQYLIEKNINIPQEYMNNPESAVQYLLNSGQMSQSSLNDIKQKASMFGFRI